MPEALVRNAIVTLGSSAAGLFVTAFVVAIAAPGQRRHIRHGVLVFVLLVAVVGARLAVGASGGTALPYLDEASKLLARVLGVLLAGIVVFDVGLHRLRIDVVDIVRDLVMGLGYAVAVGFTLHEAGLQLSSLLASGAVVTLVLGLSLQATLGNAIGGLALQVDGSIREGDWIRLADKTEGRVVSVRWRHTVIETRNWDTVVVPNAKLLAESFLILGKRTGEPPLHRMWIYFDVDYRTSPEKVIDVVERALRAAPIDCVAAEPPPNCVCLSLSQDGHPSVARYAVRYFLTDLAKDDPTSSRVNARVYTALQRAAVPLAIPAASVFVTEENQKRKARKTEQEMTRRREMLADLPLFGTLTDEEREALAPKLHPAAFATGEVITRQGAEAHWLYILAEGEANVSVRTDGLDTVVAHLRSPDLFGEAGLLTGEPRSATVTATCPVLCLRLDKEDFRATLTARPELATELSRVLTERKLDREAKERELDADGRKSMHDAEHGLTVRRIQRFFGLDDEAFSRRLS